MGSGVHPRRRPAPHRRLVRRRRQPRPLPPRALRPMSATDTTRSTAMHAVVLAGGRGVRLRPYTTRLPKPLVPIGDEHSILDIVLSQLAQQRFDRVTLAIGHLGHLIRAYVGT